MTITSGRLSVIRRGQREVHRSSWTTLTPSVPSRINRLRQGDPSGTEADRDELVAVTLEFDDPHFEVLADPG